MLIFFLQKYIFSYAHSIIWVFGIRNPMKTRQKLPIKSRRVSPHFYSSVVSGNNRLRPEEQAVVHRDSGCGRDESGAVQLPARVRERARGDSPLRCPRSRLGRNRLRPPLRPLRRHVRNSLRLHAKQTAKSQAGISQVRVVVCARVNDFFFVF